MKIAALKQSAWASTVKLQHTLSSYSLYIFSYMEEALEEKFYPLLILHVHKVPKAYCRYITTQFAFCPACLWEIWCARERRMKSKGRQTHQEPWQLNLATWLSVSHSLTLRFVSKVSKIAKRSEVLIVNYTFLILYLQCTHFRFAPHSISLCHTFICQSFIFLYQTILLLLTGRQQCPISVFWKRSLFVAHSNWFASSQTRSH